MTKSCNRLIVVPVLMMTWQSCGRDEVMVDNEEPQADPGVHVSNSAVNFTESNQDEESVSLENFRGSVILLVFSTMW